MKNNGFCGHYYETEDVPQFVLYYKSKPLPDRPIYYKDLNIRDGDYIDLEYIGLMGGSPTHLDVIVKFYSDELNYYHFPIDWELTMLDNVREFKLWLGDIGNSKPYYTIFLVGVGYITPLIWKFCYFKHFLFCEIFIEASANQSDNSLNLRDFSISDFSESDSDFELQSGVFPQRVQVTFVKWLIHSSLFDRDYVLKLVEDLMILIDGLYDSYTTYDVKRVVKTIVIFLKLRNNTSIIKLFSDSKIINYISFLMRQPQEESGVMDALDTAERVVKSMQNGKKLKVAQVIYRLGMFALTASMFDSFGLNLDLLGYSKFDQELLRRKNQVSSDTLLELADGLIFLLKKGYQIIQTKSVDCIYHSEDEYSKLYDDIEDLKLKKDALNNPEALSFNEFEYGDKLDRTIDKLQCVVKYASALDKHEVRYWRSQLVDLRMIKNNILIARNCSESREAPFAILFHATPGVGKSTLTKMTFQHLAKTHELPTDDRFMYIRNPHAKYMDGFKSEMHTIVLDDISLKNPTKNPTGDLSLDEVYMISGTFQYIPDQAALEDKGKVPVRIKFLLGTTNVKDLNAYSYYSVPGALQRRFPYVVTVRVKKKYQMDDDSGRLDASKTACSTDEYPNYWSLKVERVIVDRRKDKQHLPAKYDLVKIFDDINEFTSWLSKASISHFENERVMTTAFRNMQHVEICKECYKAVKHCKCIREQSGNIVQDTTYSAPVNTPQTFTDKALRSIMYFVALIFYYFFIAFAKIATENFYRSVRHQCESRMPSSLFTYIRRENFKRLASKVKNKMGYPAAFAAIVSVLTIFYSIFKFRQTAMKNFFTEQSQEQEGNTDFRTPKPGKYERPSPWVADNKKLDTMDLTPVIISSNQHSREDMIKRFARNVVRLIIHSNSDKKIKFINNAFFLKSNIVICNAHFFDRLNSEDFTMIVIGNSLGDGVNDRITVPFKKKYIHFNRERDYAVFTVYSMAPRRDISSYFAKKGVYTIATGTLLGRDCLTGDLTTNAVHNVTLQNDYKDHFGTTPYKGPITMGVSSQSTRDGDCGSMMLLHTPKGHFITGFHRAANTENVVIGVCLYQEDILEIVQTVNCLSVSAGVISVDPQHTIQSGLHPKSVFNYIPEGSAIVYGSVSSYKSNSSSRVCATPLRKYLVEKEGYPVDYQAPVLKGYKPWFIAASDLSNPIVNFDEERMRQCAEGYLRDILKNVPLSDIKNMVHKYDLFTAVNGAAGVAFVDSINRSTSMGYPYCTTKRKYLKSIPPQRGLLDPVQFTDEIETKVYERIEIYKREERTYPVFKGTLKDEPVTKEKYIAGKTRLFGSAPIDYILVQRMYFLSLVRLIQTHKMAFECAVGVVAQTKEWELFYKKLTQKEYLIAGDFSKYDKQMPPFVIMLAYWVLIEIAKISGNYTDEDINIMRGIATDTAYPFMLFNGDFVQWLCSNPSGQSLTVIINCIVNCIYFRYVYSTIFEQWQKRLSEENEKHLSGDPTLAYIFERRTSTVEEIIATFQETNNFFCYGDDNENSTNMMWFNFSAIKKAFADMGIKYTPPSKDDTEYEHMKIEEIDFLKRSYRYDPDLECIVAPLSEDSINKMLTTWVASDTISAEAQTLAVISSAIREYFFYGREIFEEKRNMFVRCLKYLNLEHMITNSTLPTYETLKLAFNDSSDSVLAKLPDHSFQLQSGEISEVSCGAYCKLGFIFALILIIYIWVGVTCCLAYLITVVMQRYYGRTMRVDFHTVVLRSRRLYLRSYWTNLCHIINVYVDRIIDLIFAIINVLLYITVMPLLFASVLFSVFRVQWRKCSKIQPLHSPITRQ